MMTVRDARLDELHALVVLLRRQFAEHEIALRPTEIERAVAGLLQQPERGFILVAARGSTVVGLAVVTLVWSLEHGGISAWLDELYVDEHERGRGAGRQLTAAAMAAARRRGCVALDLEVERGHEAAERLYESLGFRPHSRRRWVTRLM